MSSAVSADAGCSCHLSRAEFDAEGVLNPGSGRSPDGWLWLLPCMVAAGNESWIGLAEVLIRDGQPAGVRG